jgi:hypothetical protein
MKIDRGDVVGFILGVVTSVVASIIWDKYKERQKQLAYGEKKIIEEMKSAIDGLKQHINNRV